MTTLGKKLTEILSVKALYLVYQAIGACDTSTALHGTIACERA